MRLVRDRNFGLASIINVSLGVGLYGSILTQREQFHSNRSGDAVSLYNPATQQRINELTQLFVSRGADLITAQDRAFKSIEGIVRREAYVMAFNDCFYFIGFALLYKCDSNFIYQEGES